MEEQNKEETYLDLLERLGLNEETKKIIIEKKMCLDDCSEDNEYIIENNNICYKPTDVIESTELTELTELTNVMEIFEMENIGVINFDLNNNLTEIKNNVDNIYKSIIA